MTRHDNEAHRFYALAALGASQSEDALPAMADCLMDPDPDVRVQALESIESVVTGRATDDAAGLGDRLIEQLQFDPDADAKVAAMRLLAALGVASATPLVAKLAAFELDDTATAAVLNDVAWDEEDSGWEHAAQVQRIAVETLGSLGGAHTEEALRVLNAIVRSSIAEDLGVAACAAMAQLGDAGQSALEALLTGAASGNVDTSGSGFSRDERSLPQSRLKPLPQAGTINAARSARVRRAAIGHLLACGTWRPGRALLADPDDVIRVHAVELLAPTDNAVARHAATDDAAIVRAASAPFVTADANLVKALLDDRQPEVRRAALNALAASPDAPAKLARRVSRMLDDDREFVAAAVPAALARLAEEDATPVLLRIVHSVQRSQPVRVQALRTLLADRASRPLHEMERETLRLAALDHARDVRQAAVTLLVDAARAGDAGAAGVLAALLQAASPTDEPATEDGEAGQTASSAQDAPCEAQAEEVAETPPPSSTLDAIMAANDEVRASHGEHLDVRDQMAPEDRARLATTAHWKQRKHISLDGDDDQAMDTARLVARAVGGVRANVLDVALVAALRSADEPLVEAAARSLAASWGSVPADCAAEVDLLYAAVEQLHVVAGGTAVAPAVAAVACLGAVASMGAASAAEASGAVLTLGSAEAGDEQDLSAAGGAEAALVVFQSHDEPYRRAAALRARANLRGALDSASLQACLDDTQAEVRQSAIALLATRGDADDARGVVARLADHGGADALAIGRSFRRSARRDEATTALCKILRDGTRQRHWRFAMQALAETLGRT